MLLKNKSIEKQKNKIIAKILQQKFPEMEKDRNLMLKVLSPKKTILKKRPNRKNFIKVEKRKNTNLKKRPNRKNFTVEEINTNFEAYSPISLAFFGNYKVKVQKNNHEPAKKKNK